MRTRKNNDRILLECLVRKYGKNGVKNAIRRINEGVIDTTPIGVNKMKMIKNIL